MQRSLVGSEMCIRDSSLPDYGLVGSDYHSCHYQSNHTNFLESHGNWRTLLYSWSWILRQEKTLFPHDLASLYPSCVRTPIHRHCLLHVKKLRNSVSTFFFTHIDKVLVQAYIISQFRMKRSYQHIFFLGCNDLIFNCC